MEIMIDNEKYLLLEEVLKRTGLKQASLYEKMRYDRFPKPFKPESRAFWKESEIESYIENTKNGEKK